MPADLISARAVTAERRNHAEGFVYACIDGALNHSAQDYDPLMMPWSRSEHRHVMDEVGKIRDRFSARARKRKAKRHA